MPVGNWGGYVLAGGKSSRMGQDKALMAHRGIPMLLRALKALERVVCEAAVVGAAGRYGHFGYRAIPDSIPEAGPLAGIEAALRDSAHEWNLILACDMPMVAAEDLQTIQRAAEQATQRAVIPVSFDGREQPLCAAYRKSALRDIEIALRSGERKILRAFERANVAWLDWPHRDTFLNINTPSEWQIIAQT